jgi:hypothetical protein
MRVLFDHSTPAPLRRYLKLHLVTEAIERGWDELANGELLSEAEAAGFEVFLTADRNIRYQQNLKGRKIAIVELSTPRWPIVRNYIERVLAAVDAATPGSYTQVNIPLPPKEPFTRS